MSINIITLCIIKTNKKEKTDTSTITISNFHNIDIVNLEYLGNDEWSENWGTVGDMGFLLKVIQIINNQDFVYDNTNNYGQGINEMINPDNN